MQKHKRILTILLSLLGISGTPLLLLETGLMTLGSTSVPQQVLPPVSGTADSTWRSSEVSFGYERFEEERPKGLRKGCICMDNVQQYHRGAGACAGHGGVRFWLYETTDATVYEQPTKRHKKHPLALTEDELQNLSSFGQKKKGESAPYLAFYEFMVAALAALTFMYLLRTIWKTP
jgi:hypothetical protein